MTWWIAFIIAVLGWYFTATQNAKNSIRSLINQEIKEARTKLHELIVSCSSGECEFPLQSTSEEYVKMQTYLVSIQELNKLYASYHVPYFKRIKILATCVGKLNKLFEYKLLNTIKGFVLDWCSPKPLGITTNSDLSQHMATIRQSLTTDMEDMKEDKRIAALNLEYRNLCLSYQFVS